MGKFVPVNVGKLAISDMATLKKIAIFTLAIAVIVRKGKERVIVALIIA